MCKKFLSNHILSNQILRQKFRNADKIGAKIRKASNKNERSAELLQKLDGTFSRAARICWRSIGDSAAMARAGATPCQRLRTDPVALSTRRDIFLRRAGPTESLLLPNYQNCQNAQMKNFSTIAAHLSSIVYLLPVQSSLCRLEIRR